MATIPTAQRSASETTIAILDLSGGPHAFVYDVGGEQTLWIDNQEVGNLTVNLLGDAVVSFPCDGIEDIDVSGGYDFVLATGILSFLRTNERKGYLGATGNSVVVTITGATGLSNAWITK
jgi:hypothetical protein